MHRGGERIKVISSISSSEASIIIDELNRVLRFGFSDVFVVYVFIANGEKYRQRTGSVQSINMVIEHIKAFQKLET